MANYQKRFCPTETEEEVTLSGELDKMGYTHWHVPQETYTTSWKQKMKNEEMGVLSGVSDHWVKVPTPLHPNGSLIVIELKRQFGNTPTDKQIEFINEMNLIDNVAAVCCYGADEALKVVEEMIVGKFTTYDFCMERMKKIEENRKNKAKKRKKTQNSKNTLPY